jgi:hypothetical protein
VRQTNQRQRAPPERHLPPATRTRRLRYFVRRWLEASEIGAERVVGWLGDRVVSDSGSQRRRWRNGVGFTGLELAAGARAVTGPGENGIAIGS